MQFNKIFQSLKRATADNRLSRKERASIPISRTPHLAAIRAEVLSSSNPRQSFDSLFRGRNPATDQPNLIEVDELTGVTYDNVRQGVWGSCSVLAAAIGQRNHWVNPNRTTTFRFYSNSTPVYITVTNQGQISGAHGFGGMLERAWVVYLDKSGQVQPGLTAWDETNEGNRMEDTISAFSGEPATVVNGLNLELIQERLSRGKTVLFAQHEGNRWISPVHAYRVTGIGADGLLLKDPRGFDSVDGLSDGWIVAPFAAFSVRSVFAMG